MRPPDSHRRTDRSALVAAGFIAPWAVGFCLLIAYPFAASLYWSLCSYDLINPPRFIGTENYERLAREVVSGEDFGKALRNTAYYSLISVPLSVALGVGLATLLSAKIRGQAIYRTLFFLPSVVPVVSASVLWIWLLDPQAGLVNHCLGWLGVPPQNWFASANEAFSLKTFQGLWGLAAEGTDTRPLGSKDGLVLMSLWGVGNFMVIYLAAIGDIPKQLYEAAELDGAGRLRQFRHVTLPMLTPVIFFNVVMGLIQSVQSFTQIYLVSEGTGGPARSTLVLSMHLFLASFQDLQMGYASAMAWIIFVLLLICTAILFRSSRYWVHYRSGMR